MGQATPNQRLRNAIASAQLSVADVARTVQVDVKTVQRWLSSGRTPYRRHRRMVAMLLKVDETYLWPSLVHDSPARSASAEDLVTLYSHRGAVPPDLWLALVNQALDSIDILVYAGLFLWDVFPDLPQRLADKAARGTRVRLALGDPESEVVRLRGREEGIGDALSARISMSLTYLADLASEPGVELRLHATPLYNSLYRFDRDLLVNAHAYGWPAAHSLVLHVKQLPGARLFNHYLASFERVWEAAQSTPQLIG